MSGKICPGHPVGENLSLSSCPGRGNRVRENLSGLSSPGGHFLDVRPCKICPGNQVRENLQNESIIDPWFKKFF